MTSNEIKKSLCENFLNELSVEKILNLSNKFKYHEKGSNVSHKKFIDDFFEIFGHKNSKPFTVLYELIFTRFRTITCSLVNQRNRYYLTKITSEEEINVYEICITLAIFLKCDYKTKLKLLFDLSDNDEDGFINEKEIVKLITTVHLIFAEEETPIQTNSTILHQSLMNIKISQAINLLFYLPGHLKTILIQEKYVNFDTFYNVLIGIPEYKYKILPCFVNFRSCLLNIKKEKELSIKEENKVDFLNVSNEIISPLNINARKKDLKQSLSLKSLPINKSLQLSTKILPKINQSQSKKKVKKIIFYNEPDSNEAYRINYNNIRNIEVQPALIDFENSQEQINHKNYNKQFTLSQNQNVLSRNRKYLYQQSINSKNLRTKSTNNLLTTNASNNKNSYMTYNEIMNEIKFLSNKNIKDENTEQHLSSVSDLCKKTALFMKRSLMDKGDSGTLIYGKGKISEYLQKNKKCF